MGSGYIRLDFDEVEVELLKKILKSIISNGEYQCKNTDTKIIEAILNELNKVS